MADEATKERTAFITHSGLYQFKVMTMGLRNSPAIFARLMATVLRPVLGKCAMVYIDDIAIYSSSLEEHIRHLGMVFDLLRLAGLKVSVKKCVFAERKVEFLGYMVDGEAGTLTPAPRNVEAIRNFQRPRDQGGVRTFLGLTNYYHPSVKDYAVIAMPLYDLLRKAARFLWEADHQRAFDQLKAILTSYPVLRGPDFSRPFLVQTDFCGQCVAAILAQHDGELEYAVMYASKRLRGSQLNWSSADGEAFAAQWAIGKVFHHYLHRNPFTLVTDSMAVRYLLTAKTLPNHKLSRYALLLQGYDFDIVHRAGKKHANVDALSRLSHLYDDASKEQDSSDDSSEEEFYMYGSSEGEECYTYDRAHDQPVYGRRTGAAQRAPGAAWVRPGGSWGGPAGRPPQYTLSVTTQEPRWAWRGGVLGGHRRDPHVAPTPRAQLVQAVCGVGGDQGAGSRRLRQGGVRRSAGTLAGFRPWPRR